MDIVVSCIPKKKKMVIMLRTLDNSRSHIEMSIKKPEVTYSAIQQKVEGQDDIARQV